MAAPRAPLVLPGGAETLLGVPRSHPGRPCGSVPLHANGAVLFVLAAAALTPLAFLIGEATENLAEHTGPGIGGFFNASFGNAPELIIAHRRDPRTGCRASSWRRSRARSSRRPDRARRRDRLPAAAARSTGARSGPDPVLIGAICLFLVPSIPGWHGNADRHSLYLLTLPVAAVLLALYLTTTTYNLRERGSAPRRGPPKAPGACAGRSAP